LLIRDESGVPESVSASESESVEIANPALRPLRGLAQDVTLLGKTQKRKGIAFAQSRKSEEPAA
jgi:hypothetical protein